MKRDEVKGNKDDGHYVDPAWLSDKLRDYSQVCRDAKEKEEDKPVLPTDLTKALMMMVDNMARRPNFSGYIVGGWLPEMKLDALETLIRYVDRYDESKTKVRNPGFAYVSRIIWQSFVRRIEKEKKQTTIKNTVFDSQLANDNYQWLDPHDADDSKFYSEHCPMERH